MSTKSTKRADLSKRLLAVNIDDHSGAYLVGTFSAIMEDEFNRVPLHIAERIVKAFEKAAAWGAEAKQRDEARRAKIYGTAA